MRIESRRLLIILLLSTLAWLLVPVPEGLSEQAWNLALIFGATILCVLSNALPIFTDPMARNFLSAEALSDRFFTLMAFLHLIGLPLFLVFGIWLHVFRLNGPQINPPRGLAIGTLVALLALSLLHPAVSHAPADLGKVPRELHIDWFYLNVYPLLEVWSADRVWMLTTSVTVLLMLMPWLLYAVPAAIHDEMAPASLMPSWRM